MLGETFRNFGDDPATLAGIFRERDLESYERLSLNPATRSSLLRIIGADMRCLEAAKVILNKHATTRETEYIPVDTGDPDRILIVQLRAAFAITDWRLMPALRADYLLTHRENPFEKHHVYPSDRFLPDPGMRLGPADRAAMAVRAAILGRLAWGRERGEWFLKMADLSELPAPLGASFEAFSGQAGYRLAVDVASHFGCYYLQYGPDAIRQAMSDLRCANNGSARVVATMDPALIKQGCQRVDAELDWWARNSAPAALEFSRRPRELPVATQEEAVA